MSLSARLAVLPLAAILLAACAPSQAYREGRGFFSPSLSHAQVEAATRAGKIKHLGRFEFEASACGNYWTGIADQNLIFPTLEEKLLELNADAAVNVRATEAMDAVMFVYYVLTLPMGCSDWTVTGEAIRVE